MFVLKRRSFHLAGALIAAWRCNGTMTGNRKDFPMPQLQLYDLPER